MSRTSFAGMELRTRANHYAQAVCNLNRLPWQTLVALRRKCAKTTKTNCWWAMYELSRPLSRAIDAELYRRKVKRARVKNLRRRAGRGEGDSRP